jgi:hypothetical protein
MRDPVRPLPDQAGYYSDVLIDRLFRARAIGSAEPGGACSESSGEDESRYTKQTAYVSVRGPAEAAFRLLRETLRWLRAPTTIVLHRDRDVVPLHLEDAPDPIEEIHLQVAGIKPARWGRQKRDHRLDRPLLSDASLSVAAAALAEIGAAGPNADDWRSAEFPDGGRIEVYLPRPEFDANCDTIVVAMKPCSPAAATFAHRLAQATELLILPMGIAPTKALAAMVDVPWPAIRVIESPAEFHEVLSQGALAWWSAQT